MKPLMEAPRHSFPVEQTKFDSLIADEESNSYLSTYEEGNTRLEWVWNGPAKFPNEFRRQSPWMTEIFVQKTSTFGQRYGLFYRFDHTQKDPNTDNIRVSIVPSDSQRYVTADMSLGGCEYFTETGDLKSIILGTTYEEHGIQQKGVLYTRSKDWEGIPTGWRKEELGSNPQNAVYRYRKFESNQNMVFEIQDPYTLILKRVTAPLEIDSRLIEEIAEAKTEFDPESQSTFVPWRDIASHFPVSFDRLVLNTPLGEDVNIIPITGMDIFVRQTVDRQHPSTGVLLGQQTKKPQPVDIEIASKPKPF